VFCVSVKVKLCFFIVKFKLTVPLLCVCVHDACKGRLEMTHTHSPWLLFVKFGHHIESRTVSSAMQCLNSVFWFI